MRISSERFGRVDAVEASGSLGDAAGRRRAVVGRGRPRASGGRARAGDQRGISDEGDRSRS
ncbi:hypothetical protein FRP1_18485 [Pseudonocardia sp. EC080625-04]|nr:hypothetical protein FRP1_18485 [Pseudonocardia sp. EC080625-04]